MSGYGEFPFIEVDEYRRRHPELCTRDRPEAASANVEYTFDTDKTPAAIVHEYSIKSFKQVGTATYAETDEYDQETGLTTFFCETRMMKFVGKGKSRRKAIAKQIACYEMLKHAVENDRYKDFGILPAKTKEEALKLLEKIKPVDEEAEVNQASAKIDNWIGKLNEFCVQNKLNQPEYSFEEFGPPNTRTYNAYAVIGDAKGSATGKKKKKDAKTAAALDLLRILEPQVANMRKAADQLEGKGAEMGAEDDESEPIEGLLAAPGVNVSRAQTEAEPQKALEGILSDKNRFLSYNCRYRDLDQPSTRGRSQSMLTVLYTKAPPQPFVNPDGTVTTPKVDKDAPVNLKYVFGGEGMDSTSARDEAARSALVHFLTYFRGQRETTPAPDTVEM